MFMVRPVVPDISPITTGNFGVMAVWLTVLVFTGFAAYAIADYLVQRYNSERKKTVFYIIAVSVILTLVMLCFFGLSATTVKGIVMSLIMITASYEDIKTRECDDSLHILIVVAAFIGIEMFSLVEMTFAAITVFAVMMATALITKSEIGGADIKLSVACAFLFGIRRGLSGLMLGLMLAVAINLVKGKKRIKEGFPMIPYLAAGYMAAYFI